MESIAKEDRPLLPQSSRPVKIGDDQEVADLSHLMAGFRS